MKSEDNLILFVKNPELGKVKTRLAKTLGDQKALEIYGLLLKHTHNITKQLTCNKTVFYSDKINQEDLWENDDYSKEVQTGIDLGQRMLAAFELSFLKGYKKNIIIGSDCLALAPALIEESFNQLQSHDTVIGPAKDGGYYLLGMKTHRDDFFKNKQWSSEFVFTETMKDISRLNLSVHVLPVLSDVDEEKDLEGFEHLLKHII